MEGETLRPNPFEVVDESFRVVVLRDRINPDHVPVDPHAGKRRAQQRFDMRFAWPEHWIPVLGKRIVKLDVKEYSRKKQNNEGLWKGFQVKIGEGSIDWAAVRRELKKLNFEGWATAEVGGGDRARLADIAKRMDKVLDL